MKRKLAPWLIGMAVATLLMAALLLWATPQYTYNDDVYILQPSMGYGLDAPAEYNLHLHSGLARALAALGTAFPGTAWFSLLQLACLWLACALTLKCLGQGAQNRGPPLWAGLAAGALYVGTFCVLYCVGITHTVTAALLGGAACMQVLAQDWRAARPGALMRGLALAVALLVVACLLRPMAGYVSVAFAAGCLLMMALLGERRRRGAALAGLLALALCAGGLLASQAWENDRLGLADYLAWDAVRTEVTDYLWNVADLRPEHYAAVGWSEAEVKLVYRWYLMDENISTEAFEQLIALEAGVRDGSVGARAATGLRLLGNALTEDATDARPLGNGLCMTGLLGLLWLAGLAGLAVRPKVRPKAERRWLALGLTGNLLLALALAAYLGYTGRVPLRALMTVLLPAAAVMAGLLPLCYEGAKPRPVAAVLLALCAAAGLGATGLNIAELASADLTEYENGIHVTEAVEAYARDNPDTLFLGDIVLLRDRRLFPTYADGLPKNLLFWGGWPCRTPSYLAQLARWGIDGEAFTPEDWLRDDVRLLTQSNMVSEEVLAYLNAALYPDAGPDGLAPLNSYLADALPDAHTLVTQFYLDEELALLLEP